jgi:prepilin-type processing-associated H-X9-DG protein
MGTQVPETPSDTAPLLGALGQVSLFLGILGPFTCGASAAVGLVLGAVAWAVCTRKPSSGRSASWAMRGTVVSAAMVAVAAGVELPVARLVRDESRLLSCHKNLVQLQLGLHEYCADYDDHYPLAWTWCDATGPYNSYSALLYRCPALATARCGYTCNVSLAGRDRTALKRLETIPLVYDGPGGWNACGGAESFVPRHRRFGNMAYADGHVTYVYPRDLNTLTWRP